MAEVLFLRNYIVQDEHRHNPEKQTVFEAGKIYNMPMENVNRWIKRGVATNDRERINEVKAKNKEEKEKVETKPEVTRSRTSNVKAEVVSNQDSMSGSSSDSVSGSVTSSSSSRTAPNALTRDDVEGVFSPEIKAKR